MIKAFFKAYNYVIRFFRNIRLISILNKDGLSELTEILEKVYPGFKEYLSKLIDRKEGTILHIPAYMTMFL